MADSSSSSTSCSSNKWPHVLLVCDNVPRNYFITKDFMSKGFKVTEVKNGQEALKFLGLDYEQWTNNHGSNVNLIVVDYCNSGMSGYQLLKKVKESSSTNEIPIVIVSTNDIPSLIKMCKDAGALEFLQMPLQLEDIEKLRTHITLNNNLNKRKREN